MLSIDRFTIKAREMWGNPILAAIPIKCFNAPKITPNNFRMSEFYRNNRFLKLYNFNICIYLLCEWQN